MSPRCSSTSSLGLGGKDPIALRGELLKDHPRLMGVYKLALEKAGPAPTGEGRARGMAVHESFRSYVALVVDVAMAPDRSFTIERVTCAVDCGLAINPDIIAAQMESGIGYGLSSFLREAITLANGEVEQANFPDYEVLRFAEMPKVIDVHIVPSAEAPTGVGEPGTPVIGPALANALMAATGKVITDLPMRDQLKAS